MNLRVKSITRVSGPADKPLPSWATPGARIAAEIETRVLAPLERRGGLAAKIASAAADCGGCKADAARLDGDGGGSTI